MISNLQMNNERTVRPSRTKTPSQWVDSGDQKVEQHISAKPREVDMIYLEVDPPKFSVRKKG